MTGPQLPASAPLASGADFFTRFVQDVHVLIAEGFSRLKPELLAKEHEEPISERIVAEVDAWQCTPDAPEWVYQYRIQDERPVNDIRDTKGIRRGKSRPRIDIYLEHRDRDRRTTFVFEAKRFYPKSDETKYVGEEGLATLLNGTKGRQDHAAGMLGYVQAGTIPAVKHAVEAKLSGDRAAHGLHPTDPVWSEVSLDPRIPATLLSHHTRTSSLPPLSVYHSFLPCCEAALASPKPQT